MNFTKRGKCVCGAPCVFRPTAENTMLGQWVHVDGSRRHEDGSTVMAVTGTVKKNVEDVQTTGERL